jgi:hypothetical protein
MSTSGKVSREGEGERIWLIHFTYLYEDKTVKPIKNVLRRWGEGRRENDAGG